MFGPARTSPTIGGTTDLNGTLFINSTSAYGRNVGASIALGGRGFNFAGGNLHMSFARIQGVQSTDTDAYSGNLVLEVQSGGSMFERLRIMANGNIGINTTNPSSLLDVRGKITSNQTALAGFTNIVHRFPFLGVGEYAAAQTFSTTSLTTYTATLIPTAIYAPFGGGYEQAVGTGATRIYRLFAIYSDDIQNGTAFQIRFNFQSGTPTSQSFSFPSTWGVTTDRRMGFSETQGSLNGNHVTNVSFVIPNGVTGKASGGGNMGTVNVKISYLEIQYIDQY
jgi:hypothetical protein